MHPCVCLQVGWDVLHQEFTRLVEKDIRRNSELDDVFNKLKLAVIESSQGTHHWDNKAEESLVWRGFMCGQGLFLVLM